MSPTKWHDFTVAATWAIPNGAMILHPFIRGPCGQGGIYYVVDTSEDQPHLLQLAGSGFHEAMASGAVVPISGNLTAMRDGVVLFASSRFWQLQQLLGISDQLPWTQASEVRTAYVLRQDATAWMDYVASRLLRKLEHLLKLALTCGDQEPELETIKEIIEQGHFMVSPGSADRQRLNFLEGVYRWRWDRLTWETFMIFVLADFPTLDRREFEEEVKRKICRLREPR